MGTVFPFNRRDGPVTEVLCFDGGPRDADKRILTVQARAQPLLLAAACWCTSKAVRGPAGAWGLARASHRRPPSAPRRRRADAQGAGS